MATQSFCKTYDTLIPNSFVKGLTYKYTHESINRHILIAASLALTDYISAHTDRDQVLLLGHGHIFWKIVSALDKQCGVSLDKHSSEAETAGER